MLQVEKNSVVDIFYQGKLDNGRVLFSNINSSPYEFKIGEGKMLAGIEENIIGMKKGEQKQIVVPPEKGFGFPSDAYVKEIRKNKISRKIINPGDIYEFTDEKSHKTYQGIVREVNRETVTIDFNHIASGKTLFFKVRIEDIKGEGGSRAVLSAKL